MADTTWIDGLGGQGAADAAVEVRARRRLAGCEELVLAAHWADLHGAPAGGDPGRGSGRVVPGSERFTRLGGAGTPRVGEFAAAELGVYLGTSTYAAANLIADALDVRHRLPVHWAQVREGLVWDWQVREIAKRTRALSLEQARWVDARLAGYLGSLPWARFLALLEAKVIEADPEAAEARRKAAALDRFVQTGRCNEYGLSTVIAKATAGDALFFTAMCDRIAACLAADGDPDPIGARRSKALGILANPAAALQLLVKHTGNGTGEDAPLWPSDGPAADPGAEPIRPSDLHPAEDDSDDHAADDHPAAAAAAPAGGTGDPAAFVKALASIDPDKLLPKAVLYLHLSRESFDAARTSGPGTVTPGVARMEGVGPITPEQVREFLQHAQVTVRPVLDLAEDTPVDGYEVPARLREQLHLRTPACVFPFSPNLSRAKDADHTQPYVSPDRGGPPGQTRIGNLGPLSRRAHRAKTHASGWVHRQPVPGVHLWRTPHGYWYRTDPTGTHALGRHPTPDELAGRTRPHPRVGITLDPHAHRHWHGPPPKPDPRSHAEHHLAALLASR